MNIVIPMAGKGSRIIDYFKCPKPLIDINGITLIERSVNSLNIDGNYIFIIRNYNEFGNDNDYFNTKLRTVLQTIKPNCIIVTTDYLTEGMASSVLLAKKYINNSSPLLITNCDHELSWDSKKFINHITSTNCDGCVTTYPHKDIIIGQKSPYSFVSIKNGRAIKFEEKFAISNHSLNGLFYWKNGEDFVLSAETMIKNNDRCNNEFYISKTFNYLLHKHINVFRIKENEFCSLGTESEIKSKYTEKLLFPNITFNFF